MTYFWSARVHLKGELRKGPDIQVIQADICMTMCYHSETLLPEVNWNTVVLSRTLNPILNYKKISHKNKVFVEYIRKNDAILITAEPTAAELCKYTFFIPKNSHTISCISRYNPGMTCSENVYWSYIASSLIKSWTTIIGNARCRITLRYRLTTMPT